VKAKQFHGSTRHPGSLLMAKSASKIAVKIGLQIAPNKVRCELLVDSLSHLGLRVIELKNEGGSTGIVRQGKRRSFDPDTVPHFLNHGVKWHSAALAPVQVVLLNNRGKTFAGKDIALDLLYHCFDRLLRGLTLARNCEFSLG
jgi:hypothetical protein